jgi:Rrf2 family protein
MKIMKADEQALRIAACLARNDDQMTLSEIADAERLPQPMVTKLLAQMRRGGVVVTTRGRNGGYDLAQPADQTSVADILRSLGKPLLEGAVCTPSAPLDPMCPHADNCGRRSVWTELGARITDVLENTTLADLCGRESSTVLKVMEG